MKIKSIINAHKKIGLTSVIVIIMLVITGILLNHTEALKLNQQNISSKWLNSWYGIDVPQAELGIQVKDTWFSDTSQTLFVNPHAVSGVEINSLKGAGKTTFGWLIAGEYKIILLMNNMS